ncbi:calcium-binding protein, partial [Nostoc sp.]|uniref:calcium-binding protein n=1 Tax=Nostoc sp. TaxID=1180 RepID=UPI002FF7C882
GSLGNNRLLGGDGNDFLDLSGRYSPSQDSRSFGNNTLIGGAGNDSLSASGSLGNNRLLGGDGNDFLDLSGRYSPSQDSRSSGNNTLEGGAGNDSLSASGSLGDNWLLGGDGNDYLTGGNGNDSLIGGSGNDTFVFNSFNEGIDTIYDFNATTTNELIQVSAAGFGGGLSLGTLSANQFTLGASATTNQERFIYNTATGGLFFDLDGSASGFTQVQFAQLSAGLSVSKNNFVVV